MLSLEMMSSLQAAEACTIVQQGSNCWQQIARAAAGNSTQDLTGSAALSISAVPLFMCVSQNTHIFCTDTICAQLKEMMFLVQARVQPEIVCCFYCSECSGKAACVACGRARGSPSWFSISAAVVCRT